jgi:hypothetical protein
MWLLPWAYDSPVKIANYDEMMALGKKGVEGIQRRHGAKWKLGQGGLLDQADVELMISPSYSIP